MNDVSTSSSPREIDTGGAVELSFPAQGRHAAAARSVAAALAAEAGFDVDEIDDLRLAVDEAVSVMIDRAGPDARLTVWFHGADREISARVACQPPVADFSASDLDELAVRILTAVTDGFEVADGALTVTRCSTRDGT